MATLVQISYALSLAEHGSFIKAARASFVTQPTLSMQLQKLEEELNVVLFDRSRKPITPTDTGMVVLEQFRRVMHEYNLIEEVLNQSKGQVSGDFRLGIIPTMAPYIVPLFLRPFMNLCPKVHLTIHEITTTEILSNLKTGELDAGILATPINDPKILEEALFNEPFCIYHSPDLNFQDDVRELKLKDLPLDQLVIMNEGHCLRNQVIDLCSLNDQGHNKGFEMEIGSVATLTKIIDQGPFFTILPKLCLQDLPKGKYNRQVKNFTGLLPYREVGIVTYRREQKRTVAQALTSVIKQNIPKHLAGDDQQFRLGQLLRP